MRRDVCFVLTLALLPASGCAPSAVLPSGTDVPDLASDPALLAQVEAADGVGARMWLTRGFSRGEPISYWDLGPVSGDTAMPLYVLCRREGSRCQPLSDHPRIAAALPGDPGYAPFGWIHEVEVTAAYAGQVLPSEQAVNDAVSAGLVLSPEPTFFFVELAIVHPATTIELGPDDWSPPNATVYVDGIEAPAIDFSPTHPRLSLASAEGAVLRRNVYILTRDGESMPLNERARGVDLTGDGDLSDANSILGAPLAAADYTPLWTMVTVTVPASYASIDTSMDENVADYRSATDMFTIAPDYSIVPIEGRVVDFTIRDVLVNCPVQSAPGAL